MNKFCIPLVMMIAFACKYNVSQQIPEQNVRQSSFSELEATYCLDLTQRKDMDFSGPVQYTSVVDYRLVEHCLCIKYQYPGCSEGEPMLVYTHPKEIKGPERPEIFFNLMVREAGNCEKLITDSTCFSMKRMQLAGAEVLVRVNDENNILIVKTQY